MTGILILASLAGLALLLLRAVPGENLRDAALKITKALPAGAVTVTSDAIDTGNKTAWAHQPADVEYLLSAPTLTITELPNTKVITYNIVTGATSDLTSSPTTLIAGCIVQTGATGSSAAAATYRFKLPAAAQQFVGFTAVGNDATVAASDASATLEALV